MGKPDATMIRIGEGIALSQGGERAAARALFAQLWSDLGGEDADPLHRCALAHSMADVLDDVQEELLWDLRALEAADLLTNERAAEAGIASPVAGFYPSLHLNLDDCYRRLGNLGLARQHLDRARAALAALRADGYGQMIKAGLHRLAERLDCTVVGGDG